VFACLSGKRSLRAAVYLAFKGHPDVANLEGGMRAWIDAGMPVRSEHIKINSD
jgi:rhodanese-related sulfurtransferase